MMDEYRRGPRLERIEQIPKDLGQNLIDGLKVAMAAGDQEGAVQLLRQVGDTIHSRIGHPDPCSAKYDESEAKYKVSLTTGTGSARLFVNTKSYDSHPNDLIYPTDGSDFHKQEQDAFRELFGAVVSNAGNEQRPYWVVKLLGKAEEESV